MSDGQRRPRTAALAARACTNCRKRKSRCTGSDPRTGACSYCSKTGKECSFEEPVDRTPLKRKNLDAAELRCAHLESLLRSLHPDIDLDGAIAKLSTLPKNNVRAGVPASDEDVDETEQGEEELKYEWHEDASLHPTNEDGAEPSPQVGNQEDGMATFSTSESGYLGSSSGSSLLQDIAALLPRISTSGTLTHSSPSQPLVLSNDDFDRPDLASSAVTGLLIDAYFLFYNTSYPVIYEKSFRERAAANWRSSKRRATWDMLYYMVLALGHWVSATGNTAQMHSPYYSAARSRLSITMLESGTVETLQGFLLMGNYLQKRDRPNTGYNLIGIAYKMAFGLGLHRELPNAEDNMLHERRRQLFWTVYCFDSGFSITTGRPPSVAEGFFDIRLPRNVDDKDYTLTSGVVQEVDYPTPYSAIIAQTQLAKIASTIYSEFLMARTAGTRIEYQVAEAMEENLSAWRDGLPGYFTSSDVPSWFLGPRSVVLWKYQNLRILLWRGSKRNHPYLPSKLDAERRCIDIAMQSIHEIAAFCGEFESILHLGVSWYATYFLFQATLILDASCIGSDLRDRLKVDPLAWESMITNARCCLGLLAKKNSSAQRCLEILDLIHSGLSSLASEPQHFSRANSPRIPPAAEPIPTEPYFLEEMLTSYPNDHPTNLDGSRMDNSGDFIADPTIRMLIDQMPLDFLDEVPRDFLFNTSMDLRYE
ncbi:fungal-specific transcription factor domain-containing protein [Xylariales sp. PMI_506]|nr:fungal-specific transcription factor domain-containing protein [Xylariales sp. PMI_506]